MTYAPFAPETGRRVNGSTVAALSLEPADPFSTPPSPAPRPGTLHARRGRRSPALPVAVLGLTAAAGLQFMLVRPLVEAQIADQATRVLRAEGYSDVAISVSGRDLTVAAPPAASGNPEQLQSILGAVDGVRTVVVPPTPPLDEAANGRSTGEDTFAAITTGSAAESLLTPSSDALTETVTDLDELATVGALVTPDSIVLVGALPSAESRDDLVETLRGPDRSRSVDDLTVIDPDVGDGGAQAFAELVAALAPDSSGVAAGLRFDRLTVVGDVPNDARLALAQALAAQVVNPVAGAIDLRLRSDADRVGAESADEMAIRQLNALPALTFSPRRSSLSAASESVLDAAAELLTAHPQISVRVTGHTDDQGSAAGNAALSQERAASVARELADRGVDPDRMVVEGVGPDQPLDLRSGERADAINRRVELTGIAAVDAGLG